jgi:hypothetical protein
MENTQTSKLLSEALKFHRENPGCWLQTDSNITTIEKVIFDTRAPQPLDGKIWWRTHNLVRHLGGDA